MLRSLTGGQALPGSNAEWAGAEGPPTAEIVTHSATSWRGGTARGGTGMMDFYFRRYLAAVSTSLSPRPEQLIMMRSLFGRLPAILIP